jgi:hypothetical protein
MAVSSCLAGGMGGVNGEASGESIRPTANVNRSRARLSSAKPKKAWTRGTKLGSSRALIEL